MAQERGILNLILRIDTSPHMLTKILMTTLLIAARHVGWRFLSCAQVDDAAGRLLEGHKASLIVPLRNRLEDSDAYITNMTQFGEAGLV
jgi:hypothetical protein